MPAINLDSSTVEVLKNLAEKDLEFHRGGEGCFHWSVSSAGHQIACACNAESLETVFDVLQQVFTAVKESGESSREETVERSNDCRPPTPANIRSQPLTYTPPSYKTPQRAQILPATLETLERMGFSLSDALDVLENPLEVVPSYQWRSIYRGEEFDVVYAEQQEIILAILSPSKNVESSAVPRLPGQKSDIRMSIPHAPEAMVQLLERRGFIVERGGKHWKISYPPVPGVFSSMPYTPSDFRWAANFVSEIKLKYGVNLQEQVQRPNDFTS